MFSKIHYIIFVFFIVFTACYDRKEACLDKLAADYDVTADDDCMDCCKYPALRLMINQMAGDSLFRISDTLTNDLGQKYTIEDIRYYLSGFGLYQGDSVYAIREKLMTENNNFSLANDMKILRGTDRELEIGSIRAFGKFDSLSFEMGLSPSMISTTFINLPTNHVLQNNFRLKDDKENLSYFTMRFRRISPVRDTTSQFIYIVQKPNLKTLSIDKSITTTQGQPFVFSFKTDYATLLKNLDITMKNDTLTSLIYENLNKMIIVK